MTPHVVWSALLLMSDIEAAARTRPDRPNVVLIMADDLGYGDLGCYQTKRASLTPHLDRLAQHGVRMTSAYAAYPVCSPTRTALMTGRYPQREGVWGNHDGGAPGAQASMDLLPTQLKKAGYQNGWMGKWHLGWDVANHPMNHGFDRAFGFFGGMHDYFNPSEGDHHLGGPFAPHAWVFDGIRPVTTMKYFTEEMTDRAVDFIRMRSKEAPFFLYLAYNAPHTPIQAPDDAIRRHLRPGVDAVEAVRCAMIDVLDEQIGRLVSVIESEGIADQTLIIFTSDNGATGRRHNGDLRGGKMTLWEGGIRVPLIAYWPGTLSSGVVASACMTQDITSTILQIAGVAIAPERCDGVSLLPYWKQETTGDAHPWFVWSLGPTGGAGVIPARSNTPRWAVRQGAWKLVRDAEQKEGGLFRIDEDPREERDRESEHPERVAELTRIYDEWITRTKPSCGRIHSRDTRVKGDRTKIEELKKHCESLLAEPVPSK